MSVSSQQNNEPTAMTQSADTSSNCGPGNKSGETTVATAFQSFWTLSRARRNKILRVRRQLAQGEYHLDERLNVVLDRIIEDLVT